MSGAGGSGYSENNGFPLRRGYSSQEPRRPLNRNYYKDRNFSDTTGNSYNRRNSRQSPDSCNTENAYSTQYSDTPKPRTADTQRRPWSFCERTNDEHSDDVFETPTSSNNTRPASLLDELFKDRPFTRLTIKRASEDDFFGDISDRFTSLFDKADDIFSKRISDKDDEFFSKIKNSAGDEKFHLFDKEPETEETYSYRRHSDQDSDQEDNPVRRRKSRHQHPNNRHSWADFDTKGYSNYKRKPLFSQRTYTETHTGYSSGEDSDSALGGTRYERGKPRKRGGFRHKTFSESVEKIEGDDGKVHSIRRSSNSEWTDEDPKGKSRYGSNRNLFDRFGFKFGSFGTYSNEHKDKMKRDYFFRDFDDFINNFRGMKEDYDPISRLRRSVKAGNYSGTDSQGSDSGRFYFTRNTF